MCVLCMHPYVLCVSVCLSACVCICVFAFPRLCVNSCVFVPVPEAGTGVEQAPPQDDLGICKSRKRLMEVYRDGDDGRQALGGRCSGRGELEGENWWLRRSWVAGSK